MGIGIWVIDLSLLHARTRGHLLACRVQRVRADRNCFTQLVIILRKVMLQNVRMDTRMLFASLLTPEPGVTEKV